MGNGKDRHQHLNSSSSSMISLKSYKTSEMTYQHIILLFVCRILSYIMFHWCNHAQNTLKRDVNAGRTWNKHDLFDQILLVLNIYPQAIIHQTKITVLLWTNKRFCWDLKDEGSKTAHGSMTDNDVSLHQMIDLLAMIIANYSGLTFSMSMKIKRQCCSEKYKY